MRPLLAIAALILAGCQVQPVAKPAAPLGAGEQIAAAQHGADTATTAAQTAETDRLSKLRANVDAAAAAPNIEAAPVAVNELTVARGRLSDVRPDAAEVAAAAERRALVESGRAEEARRSALAAAEAGKRDAAVIAELRATAAKLAAERDKLAADLIAIAEHNRIENQKAIESALAQAAAAEDARNDAVKKHQVVMLNWVGAVFTVLAGAVIGIGGMFAGWTLPMLKRLIPSAAACGIVALFAFAAAQFLASRYFWPVMGGGAGGVLILVGAYLYRSERSKQSAAQKAAVMDATRPILDKAYEGGTAKLADVAMQLKADGSATVQDLLDAVVFDPLSAATKNTPIQATVHLMRAEEKGATV